VSHTPGPWLVQNEGGGEWSIWTRQPHIGILASVHREDINGEYPAGKNAALMASAPELLEACEYIVSLGGGDALDPVREAIAKARGATS
jgi:hypothetical protein